MVAPPLPHPQLGELSDSHLCGLAVLCVHLVTINSWREVKLIQRWRCGWWANQTHPLANSEILLKVSTNCVPCSCCSLLLKLLVCVRTGIQSGEECVVFLINGLASRTLEESVRSLRLATELQCARLLKWDQTSVGCLVSPSPLLYSLPLPSPSLSSPPLSSPPLLPLPPVTSHSQGSCMSSSTSCPLAPLGTAPLAPLGTAPLAPPLQLPYSGSPA